MMKYSIVSMILSLLVAMAMANESSFVEDVVGSSGLRGGRELAKITRVDKAKSKIADLKEEIDEWKKKVQDKRAECKPLSRATNLGKKAYLKSEKDYSKEMAKCRKLQGKPRSQCFKNTKDEKDSRNKLKGSWNTSKGKSNKCQRELKSYVKQLRNKRERIQKKRKAFKKLKAKRKKNKKRKKGKKKAEVTKELVAGQCVADHVCATIRGDPHITTFDGIKYDCQGDGEFVLAKAVDPESSFEIQARFESIGKERMVSITKAVSISTGVDGEPDVDIFTKEENGECILYYFVDGDPTDFSSPVPGISYEGNGDDSKDKSDYIFFTKSGIMFTTYAKDGNFGCVLNSKVCLPPSFVQEEDIVGLLGTPDGIKTNEWTNAFGAELDQSDTGKAAGYEMCTNYWCVRKEEDSIFGYEEGTQWSDFFNCDVPYDPSNEEYLLDPPDECEECCRDHPMQEKYDECVEECAMAEEGFGVEQCVIDIEDAVVLADVEKKCKDPEVPDDDDSDSVDDKSFPTPPKEPKPAPPAEPKQAPTPAPAPKSSASGDPHFKTWTGDKFDYHGECDLVLVDNPTFADGLGLKLHIRTTRVKHFSFIEKVALQIGSDVLEFDNDVDNFLINGAKVEENKKHHKTHLGGYVIRRDPQAISVRIADGTGLHQDAGRAKIDFHMRKNGFPAVIVDAGASDLFKGSLGLLGEWGTGRKLARDGETVMEGENGDHTAFALEWQVRDTEPVLFQEARFPQFPTTCTPPEKMVANRIGSQSMRKEAEEACAHWKEDKEDCIFDVMATEDILVAQEGHIVHVM